MLHDLRSRPLVFDWQYLCAARHLPTTSQLYPLFGEYCWGQPGYSRVLAVWLDKLQIGPLSSELIAFVSFFHRSKQLARRYIESFSQV